MYRRGSKDGVVSTFVDLLEKFHFDYDVSADNHLFIFKNGQANKD